MSNLTKYKTEILEDIVETMLLTIETDDKNLQHVRNIISNKCVGLAGTEEDKEKCLMYIHTGSKYELINFDEVFLSTIHLDVAKYVAKTHLHKMCISYCLNHLEKLFDNLSLQKKQLLLYNQ